MLSGDASRGAMAASAAVLLVLGTLSVLGLVAFVKIEDKGVCPGGQTASEVFAEIEQVFASLSDSAEVVPNNTELNALNRSFVVQTSSGSALIPWEWLQGPQGINGQNGQNGQNGINGINGTDGGPGPQGLPGADAIDEGTTNGTLNGVLIDGMATPTGTVNATFSKYRGMVTARIRATCTVNSDLCRTDSLVVVPTDFRPPANVYLPAAYSVDGNDAFRMGSIQVAADGSIYFRGTNAFGMLTTFGSGVCVFNQHTVFWFVGM